MMPRAQPWAAAISVFTVLTSCARHVPRLAPPGTSPLDAGLREGGCQTRSDAWLRACRAVADACTDVPSCVDALRRAGPTGDALVDHTPPGHERGQSESCSAAIEHRLSTAEPHHVTVLLDALEAGPWQVRLSIVRGLENTASVGLVEAVAASPRLSAAMLLRTMGSPFAHEEATRFLAARPDAAAAEQLEERDNAAWLGVSRDPPAAVDSVRARLASERWAFIVQALRAHPWQASLWSKLRPELERLRDHPNYMVREAAEGRLADLGVGARGVSPPRPFAPEPRFDCLPARRAVPEQWRFTYRDSSYVVDVGRPQRKQVPAGFPHLAFTSELERIRWTTDSPRRRCADLPEGARSVAPVEGGWLAALVVSPETDGLVFVSSAGDYDEIADVRSVFAMVPTTEGATFVVERNPDAVPSGYTKTDWRSSDYACDARSTPPVGRVLIVRRGSGRWNVDLLIGLSATPLWAHPASDDALAVGTEHGVVVVDVHGATETVRCE